MKSYYATKANELEDDLHQSKKGAMKLAEIMSGLLDTKKESVSFMIKNKNSGLYQKVYYPPQTETKTAEETDKLKKTIKINFNSDKKLSINGESAINKVNDVLTDTVVKVKEIVLSEKEKKTQIEKIKQITRETIEEINLLTKYIIDQSKGLVNKLEKIKNEENE